MSNNKAELEKYYRNTTYSIYVEQEKYDIKIETPFPSAIKNILKKEKTAALLTAWNPRSQQLPLEENTKRNRDLKSYLLQNYTVLNARGQGSRSADWPAEESYFILGISRKKAEKIAVEYEQNAYVWFEIEKTASLIFTNIWRE